MKRFLLLFVLAAAGLLTAVALGVGEPSVVSVTACAHATVPAQTIAVNTNPVYTVPQQTDDKCETNSVTVPTVTETVTTSQTTTTAPTTTATPPPAAGAYVTPTGSDSNACVQAAPCLSLNRAYHVLSSGGVVSVADGNYGGQSINRPDASALVTFRSNGGANVAGMNISASHVRLEGIGGTGTGQARGDLTVCGNSCNPVLTDVAIVNGHFRAAFLRSSNVTVDGGDYGNFDACNSNAPEDGFRFWGGTPDTTPTNDVARNVWIHDIASGSGNTCQGTTHAGYHVDCVQNQGGANMLFTGVVFTGCPTSDVQMEPFSGSVIHDVTFDNVYFGQTACCNSIVLGTTDTNATSALCSTLHITNSRYFSTPNLDKCAGKGVDLSGSVLCSSTAQSGCAVPVVPLRPS